MQCSPMLLSAAAVKGAFFLSGGGLKERRRLWSLKTPFLPSATAIEEEDLHMRRGRREEECGILT